jgi:phosphoglycolate phosphatase
MKPCLIFDLDGTLVDALPAIAASLNRTLGTHGLPVHSHAAIRSFIGGGLHMLIQRAVSTGTDPTVIDSLVALYKKDYELTWPEGSLVYPGVHEMLETLQQGGYPLAVLSNKVHDFTVATIRTLFSNIQFTAVLGQRDGIPHKPDPAGALQLSTTFGTAPASCVIIGDSSVDLETAANAGMPAIIVTWGYHDRADLLTAGATQLIDHPSDLPGLLLKIGDGN